MSNILSALYNTNRKLSRHVRTPWFYVFTLGIMCVLLIAVAVVDLFSAEPESIDYQSLTYFVFFVVMFDLLFILLRVQSRSFLEPYQLALFPISKWKNLLYLAAVYLMDYKSFLYISVIGTFVLLFLKNSLYTAAVVSILIWVLLLFIVLAWMIVLYSLFGRYLDKMENRLQFLGLFFATFLLGIQQFGDDIFIEIPVISHTGNILYGLWTGSYQLIGINLLIMLGALVMPIFLAGILKIK